MQDLFKKAGIFVFIISIVVLIGLAVIGGMPETESAQKGLIYSAIFFILGLEAVVFGFRGLWEKQLIKNTPTSKVRSLAMGLVEVNGTAEPAQDTVPSPVTGTPCLFYKYEVEERRKMDDDWNTVAEDTGGTSFLLDDGTGKVLIDPRDAELEVDRDEKVKIGAGEQPPAAVSQFADRISNSEGNMDAFDPESDKHRIYKEYYVEPGEDIYVLGEAMERPGQTAADNEQNIVISRDDTTPLFLISDSSEKELRSDFGLWAYIFIIGGAIVAILSFIFIIGLLGF